MILVQGWNRVMRLLTINISFCDIFAYSIYKICRKIKKKVILSLIALHNSTPIQFLHIKPFEIHLLNNFKKTSRRIYCFEIKSIKQIFILHYYYSFYKNKIFICLC